MAVDLDERVRFGDFELDVSAYVLRRRGRRVRLEGQPLDLLILLVERRGQLVSHEEIAARLWAEGVFVQTSTGIHSAVRKIRRALRDDADSPRYVESVPRRGYRFVAPVEIAPPSQEPASSRPDSAPAASRAPLEPAATGGEIVPSERGSRPSEVEPLAAGSPSVRRVRARWWVAAGLAVGVSVAVVVLGGMRAVNGGPESDPDRPRFDQLTFQRGHVGAARFAPDGRTVVYSAAWDGGIREPRLGRLGSVESRPLGVPGAEVLAVSSRGEVALGLDWRQGYPFAGWGTLATVPLLGGGVRELRREVWHADFGPDGETTALVVGHWLEAVSIELDGRSLRRADHVLGLRISPDGRRVAVLEVGPEGARVAVVGRDGEAAILSSGWNRAQGLAWRGDGEIWFTAARSGLGLGLHAVDLAGTERLVASVPGRVTLHDVAPDGTVLLTRDEIRREMVGLLPGMRAEGPIPGLDYSWPLDLSADGELLLYGESAAAVGRNVSFYLRRADGSAPVRIGETGDAARLSPDGSQVLTVLNSAAGRRYALVPVGAGAPRALEVPGLELGLGVAWFPDGRSLAFSARERGAPVRVYRLELPAGPPRPLGPEGAELLAVAPDGGRLLLRDREARAVVLPLDGAAPWTLPWTPPEGLYRASFSADGRSVYVLSDGDRRGVIERVDTVTGRREVVRELQSEEAGIVGVSPRLITADGRSYVYTYVRSLSTLYSVVGWG